MFRKENYGATVLAHNAAGYDTKFIHKWCILKRGKRPDIMIRQGSRITDLYFKRIELRFVDSYNFFMSPLKKLSSTYGIDTIKGYFPHHFNTAENQNYIGKIPSPDMYGADRFMPDECEDFEDWYDTVKDENKKEL